MERSETKSYLSLHFSARHVLTSLLSGLFGNVTYTVRHGLIRGMKRKGGLGFLPSFLTRAADASPEQAFFSRLDIRGSVVYEVGAFHGIYTLFFCRQARQVVAYEPHPGNRVRLLENVRLNAITNVTVRNVAVGDHQGSITLVFDQLMTGAASGDPVVGGQIADTSRRVRSIAVDLVRLDDDIVAQGLSWPDLVKIDVEGMELAVLQGMAETLRQKHPGLYIEMHGASLEDKEENVRRVVRFLLEKGYSRLYHVESGIMIATDNPSVAREGHLYCEAVH